MARLDTKLDSQLDSLLDSLVKRKVTQWIRSDIRALSAYTVPDPGKLIKLDAMENPYTWPDELVTEWLEILKHIPVNRYPDPNANDLKAALRSNMNVPSNMDLMLGNGSDEIIQIILMAVSGTDRVVLSPQPSFVMYNLIATYAGLKYVGVPITNNFELDMDAMKQAVKQHRPAVIFFAYPNNPTGNFFKRQDILEILEISDGLVVIDEAYHAFANCSFLEDLNEYDNLLVMRTLSKMGLAGLRLGLLAGHKKWLSEFNKIRLPYNINALTQKSTEFALNHGAIFSEQTRNICNDRDQMFDKLNKIEGITAYPSSANFILFRTPKGQSNIVFETLKSKGILIKNLGSADKLLSDCLRVTIGTPEENKRFLGVLSGIIWTHTL
ncbi:MAG: histidinol-phosphate transaminase [Gammaproteobacteria bacterium]|nr:histidinol-phosphate transaminase [Gammaproteobacteria bacterium]